MGRLKQQTRLSQALNDIDLAIHSTLGVDEIMHSALVGFVTALKADAGDIKMIDQDEWVVRYEHGFGAQEVGLRLSVSEAPVATRVARSGAPVAIEDYWAEPADFYVGFPQRHGLRAVIAMPLIVRGVVTGCLFAWMRQEPRTFSEEEVDFARRMAASVALALDNARLFEAENEARQRAEEAERRLGDELGRARVLLRAADELTVATETDDLLERLASIVLDATGIERAFVNLIDTKRSLLTPKVATGGLKAPGGTRVPFERLSETARRAIADKRVTILDYERRDIPEADRQIAEANSSRLVLFVPLVHNDEVIGHISLDQPGERYEFSPEQIRVVTSIASQAAVVLQNVQLFEREHRIAETLQRAILEPPPVIEGLEVAYLYEPASATANVGGDFFDVFTLDDTRVTFMIGDVAGKGVEAARLTTLLRDGARAYLMESSDPASVLERLNTLAYRFMPPTRFATAFLGVLDLASGALVYCGAGHPAPFVTAGTSPRSLQLGQAPLGALPETTFEAREDALRPGEVLTLFTDGVTEARRAGQLFGEAGVEAALGRLAGTPASELPAALLAEVLVFAGGTLRDDVVVLCLARADQ